MENLIETKTLTNKEMVLVTGGNASLPMNSKYRVKANCSTEANSQIFRGIVTGMTEAELAKEIFAHAVAYYSAASLPNIPGVGSVADYLIAHADPIDIVDGGDTAVRKAAYNVIWAFFGTQV